MTNPRLSVGVVSDRLSRSEARALARATKGVTIHVMTSASFARAVAAANSSLRASIAKASKAQG